MNSGPHLLKMLDTHLKKAGRQNQSYFPWKKMCFLLPSSLPAIRKLNYYCGNSEATKNEP